jgi:hypothetical protein
VTAATRRSQHSGRCRERFSGASMARDCAPPPAADRRNFDEPVRSAPCVGDCRCRSRPSSPTPA